MEYIWDTTFESLPDNETKGFYIDDYFRRLYVAIRERMQVDHIWKIGATDGGHNKISLAKQATKPIAVAGYGFLYSKDVGAGVIEAFYEDVAGNEIQLTAAGYIKDFATAVKAVFYQNTAPAGWTIQDTLDDKLLFITKGSAAGGQTGGGAHSTGTWTQPNHTHTGPSHTHTGPNHTHTGPNHTHTTGNVTLTAAQSGVPAHVHAGTVNNTAGGSNGLNAGISGITLGPNVGANAAADAASAHNHGATGAEGTGVTSAAGAGATGAEGTGATAGSATAATWRPSAYCVIIASKN